MRDVAHLVGAYLACTKPRVPPLGPHKLGVIHACHPWRLEDQNFRMILTYVLFYVHMGHEKSWPKPRWRVRETISSHTWNEKEYWAWSRDPTKVLILPLQLRDCTSNIQTRLLYAAVQSS